MSYGLGRRRLRRMKKKGVKSKGQGQPGVPGIDPATGRLLKGWRYSGGGRPPVRVG